MIHLAYDTKKLSDLFTAEPPSWNPALSRKIAERSTRFTTASNAAQ